MITAKSSGTTLGTALLSAIAASLCCITPVIALLASSSSIAANFAWIEPARPYLIGLSIAVLAFAWYQKLKPVKTNDMDCCDTTKKASFLQSKSFLAVVTAFAILMMTFPLYAKIFYPNPKVQAATVSIIDNKTQVKFTIQGMTCEACELEINNEISKVNAVLAYKTSNATGSSLVTFDKSKVDVKTIEAAINKTGYKVTGYDFIGMPAASVTFFEVPLICNAAPNIGCGSRSKPALLELEKNETVKEAWLNRPGTVIAIVWKDNPQTETVAKPIFEKNAISYIELTGKEAISYKQTFGEENLWYRGADVDKLSKEEATTIAESAVKFALKNNLITQEEAKSIKADVEAYFKDELVKLRTNEQLNDDSENKFMEALNNISEKYIGKDRAGKAMALYKKSCEQKCDKDKSCSNKSSKSCWDKK